MPDFQIGDTVRVVEDRWLLAGQKSRVGWTGFVRAITPSTLSLTHDVCFGETCLWFSQGELQGVQARAAARGLTNAGAGSISPPAIPGPGRRDGMSAREAVREIAQRPNFHTLTLQEIGDEVGVTRERARQVLGLLHIKKQWAPRKPLFTPGELLQRRRAQGRAAYYQNHERSVRENRHRYWRVKGTAHCPICGSSHPRDEAKYSRRLADNRQHYRQHKEKHDLLTSHRRLKVQGAPCCPICGEAHERDAERYKRYRTLQDAASRRYQARLKEAYRKQKQARQKPTLWGQFRQLARR